MHMPRNGFKNMEYTSVCISLQEKTMKFLELLPNRLMGSIVFLRIWEKITRKKRPRLRKNFCQNSSPLPR